MNAMVRAHRILAALANFRRATAEDEPITKLVDGRLGESIGTYSNPDSESAVIGIFGNGLAWRQDDHLVEVSFIEISNIELPNGKESDGLLLNMRDGRVFRLPVKGRRGRFFDSMEMLRFLDRVTQDVRGARANF
jgi:hypothetical protein